MASEAQRHKGIVSVILYSQVSLPVHGNNYVLLICHSLGSESRPHSKHFVVGYASMFSLIVVSNCVVQIDRIFRTRAIDILHLSGRQPHLVEVS